MNLEAVARLQREIDLAIRARGERVVESIVLDHGSEDTDLALVADVRVHLSDGRERLFSIVSRAFINWVFAPERTYRNWPHEDIGHIYTRGGPLAIVREITGDIIVRAVLRYLLIEEGRGGV